MRMGRRQKCSYCEELAVANLVEDGREIPICAYHIPVKAGEKLPELHTLQFTSPSAKQSLR